MGPARSLRSRKKQTRLHFQPVSASSPAKKDYSDAVQDRLANVSFEGANQSLRPRFARDDDERSLPTPQPTSPIAMHAQLVKASSPLSSLRTSPPLPPRFIDIDRYQSSDDDEIIPPSSKRRRISSFGEDNMMSNIGSVPGASQLHDAPKSSSASASSSPKFNYSTPTRRSTRIANHNPPVLHSSSSTSSQKFVSVDVPAPDKRLSRLGSAESSDDDVMATQPPTRKRTAKPKLSKEDPFVVEDDADDSIPSEEKVPYRKRFTKRRDPVDDFVVENDEIEYITSDEESSTEQIPSKSRRPSRRHDSPKSSVRRSNQRSKRERQELAEDLLDLQDSEQETSVQKSRTRGGPVTTQRDKTREHFELLKKRRAGETSSRIVISDYEDDDEDDDYYGTNIDDIGRDADRIVVVSDDESPASEVGEQELMYVEEENDDFVVNDQPATTGRLGRPNVDIPLQFTSFASAKPRELFPHIIEWMVKNKISPAFNRNDDVYKLSLSRIDDQVKAQAGSRLISSAWNATFKYTILARPSISVQALPGLDEELIRTCDACNKSNHPARYDFVLSGKAYSKDTLEPIDDSDDETDDNPDDGAVSYDQEGHVLASSNMHFYLGRFCAANAEMGHKLTHWKHHLNEQVLSYLEEQGVLSAEAIVGREKLNKKKREKEAEAIVDMMQETGMVAELWQAFQDDLEDAKIGMEGHERKGGRSKARIGSVRVRKADGAIGEWVDGGSFRQLVAHLNSDSEGE